MAPTPLEGNQTPIGNGAVQTMEGSRGGPISLGLLIEFIVQRTYHELTVLAELLPRKTDMERKIEIYNFSARTRQLFVRLLALVKWANSASKVDKSSRIMAFLDKQSMLFVDTADMLARVARETVVHARLPNFHIPAAVEVLTTGSYSRLPACIRERIVPPDPITPAEKRSTLQRLNQVIQHRLVTGNLLPQMRNLKIESGRVTFYVENEFEVSLTVMGDGPNIPWRLLDIEILVEDKETGDGKALVHPLQVEYIHRVVQARIADHPIPLNEVYNCLHFFCQELQLEVLYSQTLRLCRDRLDGHIHVDEYTPGKCLTISYWRVLTTKDPRSELGYRLTVHVDRHDPARPLTVLHVPALGNKECEIADRAIRSELLSMERLLVHTIYVRTKNRLMDLKQELQTLLKHVEPTLQGSPAILSVPVLQPCLRAEMLLITVDTHTGMLQCHVPQYDTPLMTDLQAAFNGDHSRLPALLSELRFWMTQRRVEKTLQHLPATPYERLPLLHHSEHPISHIGRHRMFIRLHRHPNIILIVEFKEKENAADMECHYYLIFVKHSSIEDDPNDDTIETDIPKVYLKVLTLIEFDTFVITHGPFTAVDETLDKGNCGKRKLSPTKYDCTKRAKHPAYFISDLAHVVALCDERVPFAILAQELTKRDIAHQGLQIEANATSLVLKIIQLPQPAGISSQSGWNSLLKRLLSVSIRVHSKTTGTMGCWMVEFVIYGSPLGSTHPKEQGMRRAVYFQYELGTADSIAKTVEAFLNDWAQIVHLYVLMEDLAEYMKSEKSNQIANLFSIKSYSYSRLILSYGPGGHATVNIFWNTHGHGFSLIFGSVHQTINAHVLMREQLEAYLNAHRNLARLIHILNSTYKPLFSISKLSTIPQLGVHSNRPQVPVCTFTIIPQSATLVRIVYLGMYCLEITFRGGGLVSIRDGAYSRFDRTSVISDFMPTPGLRGFLENNVDESSVFRRRSQSEDDNPPSPVTMDCGGGGPPHHRGGPQSPAQQRDSLRFHPPLTPPSGSNPHTPSSPHPSNINQSSTQPPFGSSPATSFNLASPPNINPSPSMLPHSSPGPILLVNSPSNPLHVPSPAGLSPAPSQSTMTIGHSPASNFMGGAGHLDGSPFPTQMSPAASNWPGSPGMPRPSPAGGGRTPGGMGHTMSRVIPQRSWAGAVPTVVMYDSFDLLCSNSPHPLGLPCPDISPLERFLGCVYMRRQLHRFLQSEDFLISTVSEPGVVNFKVEHFQCRAWLNPQTMQSLHIKITLQPDHKDPWSLEELQILEKFFETRAAAPPYKPNAMLAFTRMLNCPQPVLKDFLSIMKLELSPGHPQAKWSVQWCLRIPPSATPIVPTGQAAVIICRTKLLFFLQITRLGIPFSGAGSEVTSLVLPLVYDTSTNITQLAEKRDTSSTSAISAASDHLKRFTNYFNNISHANDNNMKCSIFPAVQDLITNLTLPSEPPGMVSSPSPNIGAQMQSPAGMMHSPMSGGGGQPTYPMQMGMNPIMGPGGGGPGP
ncbi:hypothetical protein WDU94_005154 [Cyamophila willieti]